MTVVRRASISAMGEATVLVLIEQARVCPLVCLLGIIFDRVLSLQLPEAFSACRLRRTIQKVMS
jgi:hypothetical protein